MYAFIHHLLVLNLIRILLQYTCPFLAHSCPMQSDIGTPPVKSGPITLRPMTKENAAFARIEYEGSRKFRIFFGRVGHRYI